MENLCVRTPFLIFNPIIDAFAVPSDEGWVSMGGGADAITGKKTRTRMKYFFSA